MKTALAVLALLAALPAAAQDREALNTAALAATCAACHGTNGRSAEGSTVPALAGTPRPQMVELLKAFKAGTRPGATIMHQLAKGYSDAQIEQLAAYFAAQQK